MRIRLFFLSLPTDCNPVAENNGNPSRRDEWRTAASWMRGGHVLQDNLKSGVNQVVKYSLQIWNIQSIL
ncbi:hypothetical protein [Prevotella fusca]